MSLWEINGLYFGPLAERTRTPRECTPWLVHGLAVRRVNPTSQRLLITASRRAHKGRVGYTRALYEQIFRIAD